MEATVEHHLHVPHFKEGKKTCLILSKVTDGACRKPVSLAKFQLHSVHLTSKSNMAVPVPNGLWRAQQINCSQLCTMQTKRVLLKGPVIHSCMHIFIHRDKCTQALKHRTRVNI